MISPVRGVLVFLWSLGSFLIAGYVIWIPLCWVAHDLWLDRYRARQILCAEYREGAYRSTEAALQSEMDLFCEEEAGIQARVGVRLMNSFAGVAFSVGGDVWARERERDRDTDTDRDTDRETQRVRDSHSEEQTLLLTREARESDGFMGRCRTAMDDCGARSLRAVLRCTHTLSLSLDGILTHLLPHDPLVSPPSSVPYQCVIGVAPSFFDAHRALSMWLLKRRLFYVKHSIGTLRGLCILTVLLLGVLVNAKSFLIAFSLEGMTFYEFARVLSVLIVCGFVPDALDYLVCPLADNFASAHSSQPEVESAIHYISADSDRMDVCRFLCLFIFSGFALKSSKSNSAARVARLRVLLQERDGREIDTSSEEFISEKTRTARLIEQRMLTVFDERRELMSIFATPVERWTRAESEPRENRSEQSEEANPMIVRTENAV